MVAAPEVQSFKALHDTLRPSLGATSCPPIWPAFFLFWKEAWAPTAQLEMRIIIVCGAGYVSGKEIMALELGRGLSGCGELVDFVVSRWNDGDFIRRLRNANLPTTVLPVGFISATLALSSLRMTAEQMLHWPMLILGYRQLLREKSPDYVVHTNWHHLLLLWPFLRNDRDLFWLHETIPNKPHYRRFFRALERRVKSFVPVSHAVAASLRRIGISDRSIRVVHNGMCDPVYLKRSISIEIAPIRIGIVGQIGPWKGHDVLIEAFNHLVTDRLNVELHVFGVGTRAFEAELKMRAQALGITKQIFWHGFVSDRSKIFNQVDICVVPSRSEDPLPTVAIEAAFFGLPVVASRRGGLPEIVHHGETGFLVEPGRHEELAKFLMQLVSDAGLRRAMGEKGRQNALSQFGIIRFVTEFRSVLLL